MTEQTEQTEQTEVAIRLEGDMQPEPTPLAQAAAIMAGLIADAYDEEDVAAYSRGVNVFVETSGVTVRMTVVAVTQML